MAKEGSEISIYKSTGKARYKLLDFKGRNFNDVVALLEDKNFQDIKKTEIHDDSVPGTILSQNYPEGNEVVPEETVLDFGVSIGPAKIKVRNLTGFTPVGVQDYAAREGLIADVSQEDFHDTIEKGTVISQNPKPDEIVEKGSKISVIISLGKKELPTKPRTVEETIPYNSELEGTPQMVIIYVEDVNHNLSEPYDTFAITQNVTRKIDLLIAPDTQASYRIMIDDQEYKSNTVSYPKDE